MYNRLVPALADFSLFVENVVADKRKKEVRVGKDGRSVNVGAVHLCQDFLV